MNLTLTIVHKTKKTNKLYYPLDNPCFAKVSRARWSKHATHDQITRGRRSKRAWSNCVLCIPVILSGSPNKSWLHTWDALLITTWRLGLQAPFVASNKYRWGSRLCMSLTPRAVHALQAWWDYKPLETLGITWIQRYSFGKWARLWR